MITARTQAPPRSTAGAGAGAGAGAVSVMVGGSVHPPVTLAGGTGRVITLSDHHAPALGVRLSGPDPRRIPAALTEAMAALAAGTLTLRPHITAPLAQAADIHAQLEGGSLRSKALLAL